MPADLSLLPDLDPADEAALTALCVRRTLRRGERLDPHGRDAGLVLFLRRGVVRLIAGPSEDEGVLAGLAGPGHVLGLGSALTGREGGPFAAALTEAVGFAVDGARLRRLAAERPGLALTLAVTAANQLTEAEAELVRLARRRIEQRLARLLLLLWERIDEGGLLITQDELAQMLAVQRTTVTMLAHRLKGAGVIAYGRGRIRVLDREALWRAAGEDADSLSAVRG